MRDVGMGDLRPLETFALDREILRSLIAKGFKYAGEVVHMSSESLSSEASIDIISARTVLKIVKKAPSLNCISALDLLCKEEDPSSFMHTGVGFMDGLFEGLGIPTGCITELCGQAATGKSQICMELAVSALFDQNSSSPKYYTLYIGYTEGGVYSKRIKRIASAICSRKLASSSTVNKVLASIQYFRILDLAELLSLVKLLDSLISSLNKNVRLVIIDSIAMHFRSTFPDMKERAGCLGAVIQELRAVAHKKNIAVFVTNHITSKFFDCPRPGCERGIGTVLVPALGDSWASAPNHRILLYWEGHSRFARMVKSPRFPLQSISFSIKDSGVS